MARLQKLLDGSLYKYSSVQEMTRRLEEIGKDPAEKSQ